MADNVLHARAAGVNSGAARAILTALAALLLGAIPLSASAGRPVRVYEVETKGGQSSVQDAMREVLVRATGRRESANDPAFNSLIADAQNYLKAASRGSRGQSQLIFDGPAVERAIVAAGRSVWDSDRPFTLIVLYPPPVRGAEDGARVELEQTAIERGLPITLVPLSPVDSAGNDLSHDALLGMAQRYGGDAVLVGRADAGTASGQFRWTLYTSLSSASWSGSLAAGVDGAVDSLAPPQAGSLDQLESSAKVEIDGVTSLTDFAAVERILQAVPGVRRAGVTAASGSLVTFEVVARGGSEAISRALTAASHLARSDDSSGRLAYQYRP